MPEPKVLRLADFKALARERKAPPTDALLRKQFVAEDIKQVEGLERAIAWTISTESVDRDKDTLALSGWRLDNYKKNPVVLWAHDYHGLPVARAEKVFKEDGRLKAVDVFATREVYAFADTVYQMVCAKFLNATSVGFIPLKWEYVQEEDEDSQDRRGGVDFKQQTLIEHSVVPVPSNPEALVEARSVLRGADWDAYRQKLEEMIDLACGEHMILLPRSVLEQAFRAADPRQRHSAPVSGRKKDDEAGGDEDDNDDDEPFEVHKIICPKKHHASADAAMKACKDLGYKTDDMEEHEDAYHFPQKAADAFKHIVPTCMSPEGAHPNADDCKVIAMGGPLKDKAATPAPAPAPRAARPAPAPAASGTDAHVLELLAQVNEEVRALRQAVGAGEGKGVISYKKTALAPESTAWDAGKEVAAASVDDLRAMCTWYSGDGTKKGDYKLPHHHASGNHACVWRGVANAAARLGSTSLPAADVPGVKKHLAHHYKDFGKDAPWKQAPEAWEAFEHAMRGLKAYRGEEGEITDAELAASLRLYGFETEAKAVEPMSAEELKQAAIDELLGPWMPESPDAKTFDLGDGLVLSRAELLETFKPVAVGVVERAVGHAVMRLTGRVPD